MKVQGTKGMIFGNVTELKCEYNDNVMDDIKQLVELKAPTANTTNIPKRWGPLNLRYKKTK